MTSIYSRNFPYGRLPKELKVSIVDNVPLDESLQLIRVNKELRNHIRDFGPWCTREMIQMGYIVYRPSVEDSQVYVEHLIIRVEMADVVNLVCRSHKTIFFLPQIILVYTRSSIQPQQVHQTSYSNHSGLLNKIRHLKRLHIRFVKSFVQPPDHPWPYENYFNAERKLSTKALLHDFLPRGMVRNFSYISFKMDLSPAFLKCLPFSVSTQTTAHHCSQALMYETLEAISHKSLSKKCEKVLFKGWTWFHHEFLSQHLHAKLFFHQTRSIQVIEQTIRELARKGIPSSNSDVEFSLHLSPPFFDADKSQTSNQNLFKRFDSMISNYPKLMVENEESPKSQRFLNSAFKRKLLFGRDEVWVRKGLRGSPFVSFRFLSKQFYVRKLTEEMDCLMMSAETYDPKHTATGFLLMMKNEKLEDGSVLDLHKA